MSAKPHGLTRGAGKVQSNPVYNPTVPGLCLTKVFFFLTLSQTKIIRLFQTEDSADDNFKCDENGRKFSKKGRKHWGIARYELFLLFPQCFKEDCTADTLKPGLVWKRINCPWERAPSQFLYLKSDSK